MKVTCLANSGKDLSAKALSIGNTVETVFDELKIGDIYPVYGISVFKDVLHYLLIDEEASLPSWYPAELFVVSDHLLPIEWYFNYYGGREDYSVSAIWGYKELVLDVDHFDGLTDRNKAAIEIFLRRKKEMEEFM